MVEHFNLWWKDRAPKVSGALLGTLSRDVTNSAELLMTAVFASEATYRQNADDPEQDVWYRKLLALLEDEPRWIDGQVLGVHSRGAI